MNPHASTADLEWLIAVAESAGERLLGFFRADDSTLGIERKGPRDLVTHADRASESEIIERINERFPEDSILAEESGRRGEASRCWIIDPLDGTTNFTHGHPFFAVSIALCVDWRPVMAVVCAPYLRETYAALRGRGATLNGRKIDVRPSTELSEALLATGFSYGRLELADGGLALFDRILGKAREVRRGGSAALDLAHTAAGVFSGFWEYYLQPHDVAAGALLIEEAGGVVSDVAGELDFLFGHSIVAGSPAIQRALLTEVADGPRHPGRTSRPGNDRMKETGADA